MRNVIRYIGQKNLDIFEDVKESEKYCEAFGGSFNVGFKLIDNGYTGKCILNDLDSKLINFWNCLKEDSDRTFEQSLTLCSNIVANMSTEEKERTLKHWYDKDDKFSRAAAEYVFRQNNTMKGLKFKDRVDVNQADFYLQSLLLSKVDISNRDAIEFMQQEDSESTFILIDPPYNVYGVDKYYRCNSSYFNHDRLADVVKNLKSKFIVGYNKDEYILELYKDFNIEEIKSNIFGNEYIELLIKNY